MGFLSVLAKIPKAIGFVSKMSKIQTAVKETQDVFNKGEELVRKYRLQDIPADLKDWMREMEEAAQAWKALK